MNWQSCLLVLSATSLLWSCTPLASSMPLTSEPPPVPSACRMTCVSPPEPSNPPLDYVHRTMRWGAQCKDLHDECVTALQE